MSKLCYDKAVLEMCRDLVMRAHGKFSFGSEFKPHRFAVEIKPSEDSVEFRVCGRHFLIIVALRSLAT